MRLTPYLITPLLIITALLAPMLLLVHPNRSLQNPNKTKKIQTLSQVSLSRFNPQGTLKETQQCALFTHDRHKKNLWHCTTPHARYQKDNEQWTTDAKNATFNEQSNLIHLIKRVDIQKKDASFLTKTQLKTEQLSIHPNEKKAETKQLITLTRPGAQTTRSQGGSISWKGKKPIIHLDNNVNDFIIHPPKKKAQHNIK
jgi:LPS export ABC transporter protein LptC